MGFRFTWTCSRVLTLDKGQMLIFKAIFSTSCLFVFNAKLYSHVKRIYKRVCNHSSCGTGNSQTPRRYDRFLRLSSHCKFCCLVSAIVERREGVGVGAWSKLVGMRGAAQLRTHYCIVNSRMTLASMYVGIPEE